ncbi:pilin [Phytoactinopolyspora endophytica]|uniref:pilin n=1 Tax=Phytoactinopolyspora endophytica TaxID=1642495 RepID=UPI00197BF92D|nr:pilin [Phytoactinopolyspora endophytica]
MAAIAMFASAGAHAAEPAGPPSVAADVVEASGCAEQDADCTDDVAESIDEVLTRIRNWIMGILAGLATVFLTVGGTRYVAAGGDVGEVAKAKTAFKSAGLGYGLAALAPLVVEILRGIVAA